MIYCSAFVLIVHTSSIDLMWLAIMQEHSVNHDVRLLPLNCMTIVCICDHDDSDDTQ
jgi:hypothetical protein